MSSTVVKIERGKSARPPAGGLILTFRDASTDTITLVIGYPGQGNVVKNLEAGDAVLYQTPLEGVFEVRSLSATFVEAELLITHVSPQIGVVGTIPFEEVENSKFDERELEKIAKSIAEIKDAMRESSRYSSAQLGLINKTLDEIQSASERLGRKDWKNLFMGAAISLAADIALTQDNVKFFLQSLGTAFIWLWHNSPPVLLTC